MLGWLALSQAIDRLNSLIGRITAWAIFVAILISSGNALVRYVFHISSNAWLETQWLLFGAVFMLCAAWTFQENGHIRIDIISSRLKVRTRSWIDVIGHIFFLFPFVLIMIFDSYPFFMKSYIAMDGSASAGGLPVWPGKFLIFLGFVLLGLQGISELIKRFAIMNGLIEDVHAEQEEELYIPEVEPR